MNESKGIKVAVVEPPLNPFSVKNVLLKDRAMGISTAEPYILENPYAKLLESFPKEKIRTKPCNRHEYTETKIDDNNAVYTKWVCRHCKHELK